MAAIVLADLEPPGAFGGHEPVSDLDVSHGPIIGTTIEPGEVPLAIAEDDAVLAVPERAAGGDPVEHLADLGPLGWVGNAGAVRRAGGVLRLGRSAAVVVRAGVRPPWREGQAEGAEQERDQESGGQGGEDSSSHFVTS